MPEVFNSRLCDNYDDDANNDASDDDGDIDDNTEMNTCLREHTLVAWQCHSDRGRGRPQEIYGAVALIMMQMVMMYDDL